MFEIICRSESSSQAMPPGMIKLFCSGRATKPLLPAAPAFGKSYFSPFCPFREGWFIIFRKGVWAATLFSDLANIWLCEGLTRSIEVVKLRKLSVTLYQATFHLWSQERSASSYLAHPVFQSSQLQQERSASSWAPKLLFLYSFFSPFFLLLPVFNLHPVFRLR